MNHRAFFAVFPPHVCPFFLLHCLLSFLATWCSSVPVSHLRHADEKLTVPLSISTSMAISFVPLAVSITSNIRGAGGLDPTLQHLWLFSFCPPFPLTHTSAATEIGNSVLFFLTDSNLIITQGPFSPFLLAPPLPLPS